MPEDGGKESSLLVAHDDPFQFFQGLALCLFYLDRYKECAYRANSGIDIKRAVLQMTVENGEGKYQDKISGPQAQYGNGSSCAPDLVGKYLRDQDPGDGGQRHGIGADGGQQEPGHLW